MNNTNESGRSMVEILGVLAIIGVLSVAGIASYTTAMRKHRANELLNEANKRAAAIAMQIASGKGSEDLSLAEFPETVGSGAAFALYEDTYEGGETFTLGLAGVDSDVCQEMKTMVGEGGALLIDGDCSKNVELELIFDKNLAKGMYSEDFVVDGTGSSGYSGEIIEKVAVCGVENCATCEKGETEVCAKCEEGYHVIGGACVDNSECIYDHCTKCDSALKETGVFLCMACEEGYALTNDECIKCPENSYPEGDTKHAGRDNPSVTVYGADGREGRCYCASGMVLDETGTACIPPEKRSTCDVANCNTCEEGNKYYCAECKEGFLLAAGACVCQTNEQCGEGKFCAVMPSKVKGKDGSTKYDFASNHCAPLSEYPAKTAEIDGLGTVTYSPSRMNWWSANNWCEALGTNVLKSKDLKCKLENRSFGSCCAEGVSCKAKTDYPEHLDKFSPIVRSLVDKVDSLFWLHGDINETTGKGIYHKPADGWPYRMGGVGKTLEYGVVCEGNANAASSSSVCANGNTDECVAAILAAIEKGNKAIIDNATPSYDRIDNITFGVEETTAQIPNDAGGYDEQTVKFVKVSGSDKNICEALKSRAQNAGWEVDGDCN